MLCRSQDLPSSSGSSPAEMDFIFIWVFAGSPFLCSDASSAWSHIKLTQWKKTKLKHQGVLQTLVQVLCLGRAIPESVPKHTEPALAGPLSLLSHPEGSSQRGTPTKKKAGKAALRREPAPLQQKEKKRLKNEILG